MAMINCPECGTLISDTAKTCIKCGRKFGPSGLSIVGFILSFFVISSPVSFILCAIELFKKNQRKKGLAIAGFVISTVEIVLILLTVIIMVIIFLIEFLLLSGLMML